MALARVVIFLALTVGGLVMAGYGWTAYQDERADVRHAVTVEGTVESTGVEQIGSPENAQSSVKYEAVVRYSYTYDGQEYTSESVYPGPEKQHGLREDAEAVANQYASGQTTTVYVNAEDPSRSYLIEETGGNLLPYFSMGIGGLLALLMGSAVGKEVLGGGPSD